MAREVLIKQPATSTTTIMENFEAVVLRMLTLIDADSFVCAYVILGLVDHEQKKGNLKVLLKYILKPFNSEDVKGSDDGGSSWYTKLHDHLE